jgi:hypothetical protein
MIRKFLWWCSGANIPLLEKSTPVDRKRYSTIGASVLLSSVFSTLSASYAFYTVTNNQVSSVILGLMWGTLVTNINRLIYSSIDTHERFEGKVLLSLLPRIMMAIVISLTLTYPLQLKLFENEITNRVLTHRHEAFLPIEQDYQRRIAERVNEKVELEKQYQTEIVGQGISKITGLGPLAKTLSDRIQNTELAITSLKKELEGIRNTRVRSSIGLIERMEAFNLVRKENSSLTIAYFLLIFIFLIIELTPLLLNFSTTKGVYEVLLQRNEFIQLDKEGKQGQDNQHSDIKTSLSETSIFEKYCKTIIEDLNFQITKNRLKASELLKTGIIIIIAGILGYIGVVYFFVGVYLEAHEFKPQYIYFMTSFSLLFVFIQLLGGWFLKQYRSSLNTSLYLNSLKPNVDKSLLSYYVLLEIVPKKEAKSFMKELLSITGNHLNGEHSFINPNDEQYSKDIIDAIGALKETIGGLSSKIK